MKHLIPSLIATALVCSGLSLTTSLRADQTWGGGSQTWTLSSAVTDWDGNANPWQTNSQNANFTSSPGKVTVDDTAGAVGAYQLSFGTYNNNPATWDIEPSASLAGGVITLTKSGYNAVVYNNNGGGTTTIGSQLDIGSPGDTDRYNIFDQSQGSVGGTLILNNVTILGNDPAQNNHSLIIGSTNNATKIYLNGIYTDSSASGGASFEIRFGEGGADQMNYYLNGNVVGMAKGLSVGEGNLNIGSSAVLGTHTINIYNDQGTSTQNAAVYATQGVTISNNVYISAKYDFSTGSPSRYGNGAVGVSDASSTSFTGGIGLDSTNMTLNAASGGRVTITDTDYVNAMYNGSIYGSAPAGLTKTGAGTVVLATFNTYNTNADGTPGSGPVAMDIKQGTVLANNASGSAFGNSSGTVNVEAGATLGGLGTSTQKVIAEAPTMAAGNAVIAPGDAGQANLGIAPSIATLTLAGGLEADSGLTMNFKLDGGGTVAGTDSDLLAVSSMILSGPLTINLSALGSAPLLTGANNDYVLLQDDNADALPTSVDISAPTGYALDSSYGLDDGLDDGKDLGYNYDGGVLTVQLVATPEPSTWAMMFGGLVLLAVRLRRKLARQVG